MFIKTICSALVLSAAIGAAHGAASSTGVASSGKTIKGGGFETPEMGSDTWGAFQYQPSGSEWSFPVYGSGISGNNSGFTDGNPPAPEGDQVAVLQGWGVFEQTAKLLPGDYIISFQAAQRGNYQFGGQTFRVLVDGVTVGTFTPSSTSYEALSTETFNVHDARGTKVTFEGLNPFGTDNTAFIDAVTLVVVPKSNG